MQMQITIINDMKKKIMNDIKKENIDCGKVNDSTNKPIYQSDG